MRCFLYLPLLCFIVSFVQAHLGILLPNDTAAASSVNIPTASYFQISNPFTLNNAILYPVVINTSSNATCAFIPPRPSLAINPSTQTPYNQTNIQDTLALVDYDKAIHAGCLNPLDIANHLLLFSDKLQSIGFPQISAILFAYDTLPFMRDNQGNILPNIFLGSPFSDEFTAFPTSANPPIPIHLLQPNDVKQLATQYLPLFHAPPIVTFAAEPGPWNDWFAGPVYSSFVWIVTILLILILLTGAWSIFDILVSRHGHIEYSLRSLIFFIAFPSTLVYCIGISLPIYQLIYQLLTVIGSTFLALCYNLVLFLWLNLLRKTQLAYSPFTGFILATIIFSLLALIVNFSLEIFFISPISIPVAHQAWKDTAKFVTNLLLLLSESLVIVVFLIYAVRFYYVRQAFSSQRPASNAEEDDNDVLENLDKVMPARKRRPSRHITEATYQALKRLFWISLVGILTFGVAFITNVLQSNPLWCAQPPVMYALVILRLFNNTVRAFVLVCLLRVRQTGTPPEIDRLGTPILARVGNILRGHTKPLSAEEQKHQALLDENIG